MFDEDLNGSIDAPELRKVLKLVPFPSPTTKHIKT